jgi:hypothetical protein
MRRRRRWENGDGGSSGGGGGGDTTNYLLIANALDNSDWPIDGTFAGSISPNNGYLFLFVMGD